MKNPVSSYVVNRDEQFSIRPLLSASQPVACQWYFNGTLMPEQTFSFLNFASARAGNDESLIPEATVSPAGFFRIVPK